MGNKSDAAVELAKLIERIQAFANVSKGDYITEMTRFVAWQNACGSWIFDHAPQLLAEREKDRAREAIYKTALQEIVDTADTDYFKPYHVARAALADGGKA